MNLTERFKLVDLTHRIDGEIPTWSGGCGFVSEIKMDYHQGVRVMTYKMHAGLGTHIDAPSHFVPGAASVGEIPIEELIVPVCVLDISQKMAPDLMIQVGDLEEFERRHGKIPAHSLFLAYTGWSQFWREPDRYRNLDGNGKMHFPGFLGEAAEFLMERGAVGLGIDSLSPDGSQVGPGAHFPVHKIVLGRGKYILENMANLDRMPPVGGYAIVLPPPYLGGAEAAIRAVGLVPKS
jgi:kynurenine formamidase